MVLESFKPPPPRPVIPQALGVCMVEEFVVELEWDSSWFNIYDAKGGNNGRNLGHFSSPIVMRFLLFFFIRIEQQYAALKDKCIQRKGKLDEKLALYKLYNEAEMVNTWVKEHVSIFEFSLTYNNCWYVCFYGKLYSSMPHSLLMSVRVQLKQDHTNPVKPFASKVPKLPYHLLSPIEMGYCIAA